MKPSHRKYVREGTGKHRRGSFEKKTTRNPGRNTSPKLKSPQLIVAENVGAKGPGRF